MIGYFTVNGAAWVKAQRDRYRLASAPLSHSDRLSLVGYFSTDVLDKAQIAEVPLIENPDFYQELEQAGYGIPWISA